MVEPTATGEEEPLLRQFSVFALWALIINGIIGAGIFGLPSAAAELAGPLSPFAFLICGVLMAPIMLSFSEISSYFRGTGGPILYASTAFGPLAGFLTGWAFYVARMMAFAANINLLVSSLAYFWAPLDQGFNRIVLLFMICGALTWVNVIGARQAMRSLGVLTVLKLLPLCLLVVVGLPLLPLPAMPSPTSAWPGGGGLGGTLLVLVYAYVGFESGLVPAGEARNPQRDMPRALLMALVVATVLYALIQSVAIAALPPLAESERPLVDVAAIMLGPAGALVLMAGVVASVGGNVAGAMLSTPRITYMLARQGQLPAWLGHVHPRFRTPDWSVMVFGLFVFIMAAYGSFAWLAGMSAVTRLLIYVMCMGAIPTLRRRFAGARAGGEFRLPGAYTVPIIGIIVCLWLLGHVALREVIVTSVFLASGVMLYFVASLSRGRKAGPTPQTEASPNSSRENKA